MFVQIQFKIVYFDKQLNKKIIKRYATICDFKSDEIIKATHFLIDEISAENYEHQYYCKCTWHYFN